MFRRRFSIGRWIGSCGHERHRKSSNVFFEDEKEDEWINYFNLREHPPTSPVIKMTPKNDACHGLGMWRGPGM